MTAQKKILDLTGSQYLVQKVKSAINDVGSSLSTHIADTDIHVTTADKNKWNNQTYVFRYSSTALVASSTNSNALLDNTDNLKVGDKVIDSSGVLFSITAIDTANSTFTIGTALIDLAQDSDVVHKSGDETVIGNKRFGVVQSFTGFPTIRLYSTSDDITVVPSYAQQQDIRFTDKNNNIIAYFIFQHRTDINEPFRTCWRQCKLDGTDGYYSVNFNNLGEFYPENNNAINLGRNGNRWKSVYATNYYYGNDNVEFSTKFVTTDTVQTISGNKTFSSNTLIYNSDNTANTPNLILQSSKIQLGDTTNSDTQSIVFNAGSSFVARVESFKDTAGTQNFQNTVRTKDASNNVITAMYRLRLFNSGFASLESSYDNTISLGRNNTRWKDCQTYLVNGVEPSSLSLPSGNVNDVIDISSYLVNLDGTANIYTAPANGWISITMLSCSGVQSYIAGLWGHQVIRPSVGDVRFLMPILKNLTASIFIFGGTIAYARFIPCQGNL